MRVCSAIGCQNRRGRGSASNGISYHIFPKEPHIKKKWINFVGRDKWLPKSTSTVCSSHFKANDYLVTKSGKKCLKPGAFPSERKVNCHSLQQERTCESTSDVNSSDGIYLLYVSSDDDDDTESQEGEPDNSTAELKNESEGIKLQWPVSYAKPTFKDVQLTMDDIRAIHRDSHKLSRNLTKTDVGYLFTLPVKTDNYNISSVSVDTNLKEFKKRSEGPDGTLIEDEQIKDIEKLPTILEKRKSFGSSEVSDQANNIGADPDETTLAQEAGSPKVSRKAANIDAGITKKRPLRKRRKKLCKTSDDFDYKSFENEVKVKIKLLNTNEQKAELEARKLTSNYLESPHRCETCGKGFTCLYTLTNHMANHDQSVGPYECEICHFRFADKRKWYKHRHFHRLKFTCQECGFVTRTRAMARTHFATHTGKTYQCPHCARVFAVLSTYRSHVRLAHPELSVACDQCGEAFQSPRGVQVHKTRAHQENITRDKFKCPVCDVTFSSLKALNKHTSTAPASHTAVKPCVVCGKNFGSAAALNKHTAVRHSPDQYRCDECDTMFSSAAAFDTHHRRKHLGQRPKQIKGYPRKYYLKNKNEGRVVCEICGGMRQTVASLKVHYMQCHSAVKPFKCSHCPKSFATKDARTWHERTHTGEKPHLCDLCPAAFCNPSNLRRHRDVVHLNQRKCFPCHLCSSTLTTAGSLKVHINTVHGKMTMPKRKRCRKKEKKEVKPESD